MSLKGVKKAVSRTPHQLLGKKLPQYADETVSIWEHDLTTSIAGLNFIQTEIHKYRSLMRDFIRTEIKICQLMREEEEGNSVDDVDAEYDDIEGGNVKATRQFQNMMTRLSDSVDHRFTDIESDIGFRCRELTNYLENLLKMLTKRQHKKIDVEIHSNNVQKLFTKKNAYSDKDMANMTKEQDLLAESKRVFVDIDAKIKIIIPEALEIFSDMLSKLEVAVQLSLKDVFQMVSKALQRFSHNQGMISTDTQAILKEYEQDFAPCKFRLDSMTVITKYKRSKTSSGSSSPTVTKFLNSTTTKIKKEASDIGEFAQDSTAALLQKTLHPRSTAFNIKSLKLENPVRPKLASGIFHNAADPLAFEVSWDHSGSEYATPQPVSSPSGSNPQSPSIVSSPWMKPLSLKRQSMLAAQPGSEESPTNDTSATSISPESPSITMEINEGELSVSQQTVDKLIQEIARIRSVHSKHIKVEGCPVEKEDESGAFPFNVDDAVKVQVVANSSLSSKILVAHLKSMAL